MTDPSFTPAQLRALAWLPSDGGWRSSPARNVSAALGSLCLYFSSRVRREYGAFGYHGEGGYGYRLTPSGVRLKAELIANGKLKQ